MSEMMERIRLSVDDEDDVVVGMVREAMKVEVTVMRICRGFQA